MFPSLTLEHFFSRYVRLLGLIYLCGTLNSTYAESISIDSPEKGFFANLDKTPTMFYPSFNKAKATLIFMPGGEGTNFYTDPISNMNFDFSKNDLNIVLVGSPYALAGNRYLSDRSKAGHLARLETVLRYYKEALNTPIWLYGHSNGTGSVSFYLNQLKSTTNLIDGVILSGTRMELRLENDSLNLPILFLHHKLDRCYDMTGYDAARLVFNSYKAKNKGETSFVTIEGGFDNPTGDPCKTGYHNYLGAADEARTAIRDFVISH